MMVMIMMAPAVDGGHYINGDDDSGDDGGYDYGDDGGDDGDDDDGSR